MEIDVGVLVTKWSDAFMSIIPGIIGACIILLTGWIAGHLLGRATRKVLDRIVTSAGIEKIGIIESIRKTGIPLPHICEVGVRGLIYLIAILAAVDLLNLSYLSGLMASIIAYIPHAVAFIAIVIGGFIMVDLFIDFVARFDKGITIEFITPILLVLRITLYGIVIILGLDQLMLDLTIIYTFLTPITWGIGIGLGAAITIFCWYGLKNRSEQIIDGFIESVRTKN